MVRQDRVVRYWCSQCFQNSDHEYRLNGVACDCGNIMTSFMCTFKTLASLPTKREWGPWTFDPSRMVLEYEANGYQVYEVDLEKIRDSREMIDWIFQIANKGWASADVLAGFIQALADLLNPQAHYVHIKPTKVLRPIEILRQGKWLG